MTILGKKQMSEEDIKLNYITPVILDGWKGHVTMETKITDGRINISGNIVARSKPKFADYMLYLNDGKPIAVVEAKDNNHSVSHGLQQAMTYAQMMDLPFAYSSNGDAFYEHDFFMAVRIPSPSVGTARSSLPYGGQRGRMRPTVIWRGTGMTSASTTAATPPEGWTSSPPFTRV